MSFQVLIAAGDSGLATDSKAQAGQVRSVAAARLRGRIGALPPDVLRHLDAALRTRFSV